jgi:uncharacterized protein YkwD
MRFSNDFDEGRGGYVYGDDAFRFTSEPGYASGKRTASGGVDGSGALVVRLGGIDDADVGHISGGWSKSFTLEEAQSVTLTLSFKLTQSSDYEPNEYSEALVALDGDLVGVGGRDYLARIAGDGSGGPSRSTGWRTVEIDLGELEPGSHSLTLGGYNNAKTEAVERTTVHFDNVVVGGTSVAPAAVDLDAFEARVLELTNDYRAENGRAPLANDAKLNAAAEDWSREMAEGDFFRHSTPDQVRDFGYEPVAWGENIAAGYRTPEAVVQGWIDSPGHRANLLSTSFEEIGIGYVYLSDDPGDLNYRHYWTQAFGTEADALA